jgi:ankyrin repeat protein
MKKVIEEDIDTSSVGKDGNTLLHVAAATGNEAVVKTLIQGGAEDINAVNDFEHTPLHCAAVNSELDIISILIAHGADISYEAGSAALHNAVRLGCLQVVEMLWLNDVSLNSTDENRKTALDLAEEAEHSDIVGFLVNHGAM